jgi:glycosyltransferase involved in cell wall biosynthesis
MRIIHILPKINYGGGGIGDIFSELRALQTYQIETNVTIVSLEAAFSKERMLQARALGIRLIVAPLKDTLTNLLQNADLVVVSYWNHPLLTEFMVWWAYQNFQTPLVVSVKVNGLTLPQVLPSWVTDCASGIIYSHPDTLSKQPVESLPKIQLISPHFIHLPEVIKKSERDISSDFVAFYAGSLNRFKRLPSLFELHDRISLSQFRIEYWGAGEDPSTSDRLRKLKFGVHKGFSNNIYSDFIDSHLLLNPQSPLSYGSNDKIRVECAWMGIPSLVLKESSIAIHVEDGVDGLIASDEQEYIDKLNWIAQDVKAWNSLSEATYHHIRKTYQLEEITKSTIGFYREVFSAGPRNISLISLPETPLSRLLSGMGQWAEFIISDPEKLSDLEIEYALHCEGGVIHYANMQGMDSDIKALIDKLFAVLENRMKRMLM